CLSLSTHQSLFYKDPVSLSVSPSSFAMRTLSLCISLYPLVQGSSTFFSPRTPWLRETLSRDPHPCRPKFGPDIHIIYLELSVSHTHTLPYTCLNRITNHL